MAPTISPNIPVIDFRRHSMVLEWNTFGGTWTAFDVPPALVHGVALIRASQPNICLYARDGRLHLQVGLDQYALSDSSPRIKWNRDMASLGLRRRFTLESSAGEVLFTHAYWSDQGDEFFAWLASRAADPGWRTATGRLWSEGVNAAVLRSG